MKSSRHLLCNWRTSLSTCCLAQAQHLSMRSFVVSWHNTWAQDLNVKHALLLWVEMHAVYPHLSRMAWNYLSIPSMSICMPVCHRPHFLLATSTNIECVFSKGQLIFSHIWNWLSITSTHILRNLMCTEWGTCDAQDGLRHEHQNKHTHTHTHNLNTFLTICAQGFTFKVSWYFMKYSNALS